MACRTGDRCRYAFTVRVPVKVLSTKWAAVERPPADRGLVLVDAVLSQGGVHLSAVVPPVGEHLADLGPPGKLVYRTCQHGGIIGAVRLNLHGHNELDIVVL
ncbi:MAG: hypothetical protein ACE5GE_15565, partial [Phycisphaerae bacterium]